MVSLFRFRDYMTYANITWRSRHHLKLEVSYHHQNHVIGVIFQTICLTFHWKIDITPNVFFKKYSIETLSKLYYRRKYSEFIISFRGPRIWNKILTKNLSIADIQSPSLFKTIIKTTNFNTVNLTVELYWKILKCSWSP